MVCLASLCATGNADGESRGETIEKRQDIKEVLETEFESGLP
jgi:hypothetical protein